MALTTALSRLAHTLPHAHRALGRRLKAVLGIPMRIDQPDRRLIEEVILPAFAARSDLQRVLWVGCDYYSAHYRRYFRDREFWTLEPLARNRVYGARRHVVDTLEHLPRHFAPASVDLILCNGIIGWGLNRREDAEIAFGHCFGTLRPGGELMVGWNNRDPWRPYRPDDLASLACFRHLTFEPLGTWRCAMPGEFQHVFDFYQKPAP